MSNRIELEGISLLGFKIMNCTNCGYLNKISVKSSREKTDDGNIHYRYFYEWKIDCKKEGKIKLKLEGTKYRTEIPSCSLWIPKEDKKGE